MEERPEPASPWTFSRRAALFVCYTLLLLVSFYFNVFKVTTAAIPFIKARQSHVRWSHIGFDSYLVLNRLHLAQQGGPALAPMVVRAEPAHPADPADHEFSYHYYKSQLGLQGILLSAAMKLTGLDPILFAFLASALFCLATAAVLAAFFVSVAERFGAVTSHLATFAVALSPIVGEFSTSLYWCTFLLFAPFVATWILYPHSTQSAGRLAALAGLVLLLVFLKSACGYEYLTSVTLSPLVAVIFHHAAHGDLRWKQLGTCALLFAAGCAGFVVAVTLHAWQLARLLNLNGLEAVMERARTRTVSGNPLNEVSVDFQGRFAFLPDALEYPVNCFLHYFTHPCCELPIGKVQIPVWAPVLFGLGFLGLAIVRRHQLAPAARGLAIGGVAAAVASLSWQVLVVNHMCVHFHLNQIVFWIPLLPMTLVAIGWTVRQAAARWRVERSLELLLGPVCLLLVAGNLQWHLMKETARNTAAYRYQLRVTALLDQPPEQWAATDIAGCIDGVGLQPSVSDWPRELAGSSLVRFGSRPQRELVISGWAADTGSDDGIQKIVVTQGGEVLAEHHTHFSERPDVAAALNVRAPRAGFTTTVALPGDSDEPLRVFVLTGAAQGKAVELKHPALAQAATQSRLR